MRGLALLAALVAGGCCPQVVANPLQPLGPPLSADADDARLLAAVGSRNDGYRTQRAVHRVVIEVDRADGTVGKISCRGLLAIARPRRFRLRALGPLGATLFDIAVAGERTEVRQVRGALARAPLGPAILRSVAEDLRAIYRLESRSGAGRQTVVRPRGRGAPLVIEQRRAGMLRTHELDPETLAIRRTRELGPGRVRTIDYGAHERRGAVLVPRRVRLASRPRGAGPGYRLRIAVERVALDVALDPRLFACESAHDPACRAKLRTP